MGLSLQFVIGDKTEILNAVRHFDFDVIEKLESENKLADFSLHLIADDLNLLVKSANEELGEEPFGLREHLDFYVPRRVTRPEDSAQNTRSPETVTPLRRRNESDNRATMNKVKKQHFVPQFYLKYFMDARSNIYAFDIVKQKQFVTTTANIAHDRSFYDNKSLEEFIGMEQAIEHALANTEAKWAGFFRKLIATLDANNLSSLTRDDYKQLADFITTQERRTPEARRMIADIAKIACEELDNDIQFQQAYLLLHEDVLKVVEDWCDRYWIFWRNNTECSFYTSDHPVVRHWHKDQRCEELFFPITPRYGVSILFQDDLRQHAEDRNIRELSDLEKVKRHYNFLIVTQCNRQVYSSGNNFDFAVELVKLNPTLTDPTRPRFLNI